MSQRIEGNPVLKVDIKWQIIQFINRSKSTSTTPKFTLSRLNLLTNLINGQKNIFTGIGAMTIAMYMC